MDDSSELSSELSSVPSEDDDTLQLKKSKTGILKFFSKVDPAKTKKPTAPKPPRSPSPPPREPSPEHEYVLADNPDIAFIVMFRSRFTTAFPKSLANFGPQELERGVVDTPPAEHIENLLCALLQLLLNRKQDVKRGHYNRALEEAVQAHRAQWPKDWDTKSPLSNGGAFHTMTPSERLTLLKSLILWSLSSSDAVKSVIASSYKQNRHEDDLNQPLSIQPWGTDRYKRRYYLIEGLDDTNFRIYRESNYAGLERKWFSVAGDIDELRVLAEKLATEDGGQKARLLSGKMLQAIPRFEATEEKRKRREYRQMRKQQFQRPEPGFSTYEGRTRGKRQKYTYSDEEDDIYSDTTSYTRRSTRNTGTHTPAEPTVTQSGRQVRSRLGGMYGESMISGTQSQGVPVGGYDGTEDYKDENSDVLDSKSRRPAATERNGKLSKGGRHIEGYNSVDEMDEEEDASEEDYGDDEEDGDVSLESDVDDPTESSDEDDEMLDEVQDEEKKTLVVKLAVKNTPSPEVQVESQISIPNVQSSPSPTGQDSTRPSELASLQPETSISATDNGTVPATGSHDYADMAKDAEVPDSMEISQANVPRTAFSPMSPSLAYRGSPDKNHGFPNAINFAQTGR